MMIEAKPPTADLVAIGGEIYAHIFENPDAGILRNLFWSYTIKFKPIQYAREDRACSMTCEWVPWSIQDWRELDSKCLNVGYGDDGTESTFYIVQHEIGTRKVNWKRKSCARSWID
jgi:hypothetical protein